MNLRHPVKKFYFSRAENLTVSLQEDPEISTDSSHLVTLDLKFGYPVIIQSFKINCKLRRDNPFSFFKIEGNLLGDLVDYESFLDTVQTDSKIRQIDDEQKQILYFDTSGVGEIVRLSFKIDIEFYLAFVESEQSIAKDSHSAKNMTDQSEEISVSVLDQKYIKQVKKQFLRFFETISFFGISNAKSIKPFVSFDLMNLYIKFSNHKQLLSANEVKLATALALANEKKNNQAIEMLEKCVLFLESCAIGIKDHLMKFHHYDFTLQFVEKTVRQITDIRFRCCLISILMASLYTEKSAQPQKSQALFLALHFFKKSKRKIGQEDSQAQFLDDKAIQGDQDWYPRLMSHTGDMIKMLQEVMSAEEAKYYKIAVMEIFNFLLLTFRGSLNDHIVTIFNSFLNFLRNTAHSSMFDWSDSQGFRKKEVVQNLKQICKENSKIEEILEKGVLSIEQNIQDPYISTTPILFSMTLSFFTNLNQLLPSLSTTLLRQIFLCVLPKAKKHFDQNESGDKIIKNSAEESSVDSQLLASINNQAYPRTLLTNLNLPPTILLSLLPFIKNTLLILQAESPVYHEHLQLFIQLQTLLNNSDYARLVLQKFQSKSSNTIIEKLEIFTVAITLLSSPVNDTSDKLGAENDNSSQSYGKQRDIEGLLRQNLGSLWETIKSKYLYVIGWESGIIEKIAHGLSQIRQTLERQVLSEGWKEGALHKSNSPEKQQHEDGQALDLDELKFEKISDAKPKPDSNKEGCEVKSKVEYLKSYRDIFGQFEYYLEILDCLSANFSEKSPDFRKGNRNSDVPKSPGRNSAELRGTSDRNLVDLDREIEENLLPRVEPALDDTNKKLIKMYMQKHMNLDSVFERECWESIKKLCKCLTGFLLLYMQDSVLIDYFLSTWVILINFTKLVKERREDVLFHVGNQVVSQLNENTQTSFYPLEHKIKCSLNVFELFEIIPSLADREPIKSHFLEIANKVFQRITHSSNSDNYKLAALILRYYGSSLEHQSILTLVKSLKDPRVKFESSSFQEVMLELFSLLKNRNTIDLLNCVVAELMNEQDQAKNKNYEERQRILSRRQKAPRQRSITPTRISENTLEVTTGVNKPKLLRRLELLKSFIEYLPPDYLTDMCIISEKENFKGNGQNYYDEDCVFYEFLHHCLRIPSPECQKLVLQILKKLVLEISQKIPNFPPKQVQSSSIKVANFCHQIIQEMAYMPELRPESQHDLLVIALIIFSKIIPPCDLRTELSMQATPPLMIYTSKMKFPKKPREKQGVIHND